jgi:hypothetical protein
MPGLVATPSASNAAHVDGRQAQPFEACEAGVEHRTGGGIAVGQVEAHDHPVRDDRPAVGIAGPAIGIGFERACAAMAGIGSDADRTGRKHAAGTGRSASQQEYSCAQQRGPFQQSLDHSDCLGPKG